MSEEGGQLGSTRVPTPLATSLGPARAAPPNTAAAVWGILPSAPIPSRVLLLPRRRLAAAAGHAQPPPANLAGRAVGRNHHGLLPPRRWFARRRTLPRVTSGRAPHHRRVPSTLRWPWTRLQCCTLMGTFSTGTGVADASDCKACSTGKYQTGEGSISCTSCQAGKYQTGTGLVSGSNCSVPGPSLMHACHTQGQLDARLPHPGTLTRRHTPLATTMWLVGFKL